MSVTKNKKWIMHSSVTCTVSFETPCIDNRILTIQIPFIISPREKSTGCYYCTKHERGIQRATADDTSVWTAARAACQLPIRTTRTPRPDGISTQPTTTGSAPLHGKPPVLHWPGLPTPTSGLQNVLRLFTASVNRVLIKIESIFSFNGSLVILFNIW